MKYTFKLSIILLYTLFSISLQKVTAQTKTGNRTEVGIHDTIPKSDSTKPAVNVDATPPATVDSSLMDRVTALEEQVAESKHGEEHFMMVGLVTTGFIASRTTNTIAGVSVVSKSNSIPDAGRFEFSPMFLWRHGKKFLMEFEPSFNNDGLSVNWADISYFAAPSLIIRAGYLVLPFGYYAKHLAAGWIGKLATDPIGIGLPPSSDYGVEIEGGMPLGNMKWNYDLAVTNGMQLMPDGTIQNAGINDNNTNKTFSGRLGLLPFSNSSLELGVSALYGKLGDNLKFTSAKANMYALDLNYVKNIKPFLLNIKAQYNVVNINKQSFISPADSTQTYSFDNKTTSTYSQISIRPTLAKNAVVKNFEVAFRYADFTTPRTSVFGERSTQFDVGIAYWMSWRTVLKLTHEMINNNSTVNTDLVPDGGKTVTNSWILQFSIQL